MKYCTNCGVQLSDDARFCPACGTKQEAAKAPAAEPVQPKPKSPTASKKQTTQAKVPQSQANNPEGYQEEFFIASDSSGEEVISSWDEQRTAPPAQRTATAAQRTATSEPTTAPPDRRTATPPQRTVPPAQRTVAPVQKKKKRGFFSWLIIILLILITLYFLGSLLEGCKNINLPPDPGTPVPEPHEGVFVCGNDTLVFNGDGKTVSWHLTSDSSVKNLGTQGSGTYAFLFSHGLARYDVAENLLIYKDSLQNTYLMLSIPTKDTLISIIADKGAIFEFRKIR